MKKYVLILLCSFVLACSTNDYEISMRMNLMTQINESYMKYGTISTGENLVFNIRL